MKKELSTPVVAAIVAVAAVVVIAAGWYAINPPPGEIGPKPGAKTGMRRLGKPELNTGERAFAPSRKMAGGQ